MISYADFLAGKGPQAEMHGFEAGAIHSTLYPFQADIVKWATRKGRAAIFADCGLGKSFMQVEWARLVAGHTGGRVLIVAPIAVAEQTISEAAKLGVAVKRVSEPTDDSIQIVNYERIHHFIAEKDMYSGIVLDESSILKSFDGKTRTLLIKEFSAVPYRLCCTATPAPNDTSELGNHAEFLGAMSRVEMLATFFVHDSDDLSWRLKGHAAADMWRWISTWAVFVRRPSDLDYPDEGWSLPPLSVSDEVVVTGLAGGGEHIGAPPPHESLCAVCGGDAAADELGPICPGVTLGGITKRSTVRRRTLAQRAARAAEIIQSTGGQWIVWCDLNAEEDALAKLVGAECVVINGQTSEARRVSMLADWVSGKTRVLISKAAVFGFGLNLQNCHQVMFLGLGDSYEKFYQAVRRCWRFGQKHPVDVRIVVSDVEGAISINVKRKEAEAATMAESIIEAVRELQTGEIRHREDVYMPKTVDSDKWIMLLGDCVERTKELPTASVGLSVFSPPFASLYTYSASRRDLGNCSGFDEFFQHFSYLIPEILRVTMPGRRCAVHCQQLSTTKAVHGFIGWRDFRGELIRAFQAGGWVYDGEICIDKNPQVQAVRTKSKQLMFVQKAKDSSWLRPGMADYVLLFRHPDESSPVPVKTDVTNEEWILFAHPIWYDIKEGNVLKFRGTEAREEEDEKHICPLQLETIERCIRLWSNPGEIVFSPFAGIGSEGYVARRFGREFIGIELKESYFNQAVKHLGMADSEGPQDVTHAAGLDDIVAKRAARAPK